MPHYERDIFKAKNTENEVAAAYYSRVAGLKDDLSGAQTKPEILKKAEDVVREGLSQRKLAEREESDGNSSSISSGEEEVGEGGAGNEEDGTKKGFKTSARPRDESPNSRKVGYYFLFWMGK